MTVAGDGHPLMAELVQFMPPDLRRRWRALKRMEAEGVRVQDVAPDEPWPSWRRIYRADTGRTLGWVSSDAVIRYTGPTDPAHYAEFSAASRARIFPVMSYRGVGGAMRWIDRLDREERVHSCII